MEGPAAEPDEPGHDDDRGADDTPDSDEPDEQHTTAEEPSSDAWDTESPGRSLLSDDDAIVEPNEPG